MNGSRLSLCRCSVISTSFQWAFSLHSAVEFARLCFHSQPKMMTLQTSAFEGIAQVWVSNGALPLRLSASHLPSPAQRRRNSYQDLHLLHFPAPLVCEWPLGPLSSQAEFKLVLLCPPGVWTPLTFSAPPPLPFQLVGPLLWLDFTLAGGRWRACALLILVCPVQSDTWCPESFLRPGPITFLLQTASFSAYSCHVCPPRRSSYPVSHIFVQNKINSFKVHICINP